MAAIKWSVKGGSPFGNTDLRRAVADVYLNGECQTYQKNSILMLNRILLLWLRLMRLPLPNWLKCCSRGTANMRLRLLLLKKTTRRIRWSALWLATLRSVHGFRAYVLTSLLSIKVPSAASAVLMSFITGLAKVHPAVLLPVKPNPRPYSSPVASSKLDTVIYATANPELNFAQQAVSLAFDASKYPAAPGEISKAWQLVMRQFAADGGFNGQEPLQQLLVQVTSQYFGSGGGARSTDMLSSMMSNLLGGGQQESAPALISIKQLPRPADPSALSVAPASQNEADQLMDDEMD